jgi:hypothetical protein
MAGFIATIVTSRDARANDIPDADALANLEDNMRFSLVCLIAVFVMPLPNAVASPFDFIEEIEQRGGGGMGGGGGGFGSKGGRCASFAKANRCKPRFDSRVRSCVCT